MLESVAAVRFDRRMGNGRNWPCLLAATRNDGSEIEVITKFSNACERRINALIVEAITAMLAADLDLPVPNPLIVEFDNDFVDLIARHDPPLAQRIQGSVPKAFGSTRLSAGFSTIPIDKPISKQMLQSAADIFAFDMLILNGDRLPNNPNCQSKGKTYAIFDHELAFVADLFGNMPLPWVNGSLEYVRTHRGHVFFSGLVRKNLNFDRLEQAWGGITNGRLAEYRAALPPEWTQGGDMTDKVLNYIANVRDNISPGLIEVKRILS